MKKSVPVSLVLATLGLTFAVQAADVPSPGPNDSRIRVVNYKVNEVTAVAVQRGVVTRIMLEEDEKIAVAVVGLSSDCSSAADEWCISAVKDTNQIFVRPRDSSRRNNMELRTNKRDYSFVFDVVGGAVYRGKRGEAVNEPFYRVVFQYAPPKPLVQVAPVAAAGVERDEAVRSIDRRLALLQGKSPGAVPSDPDYGMSATARLKAEGIGVRNTSYSKQVLEGGGDAEPAMVFDDGRFTYFEFPGAREIPAVFAHGSDDEPTRVNWHMNGNFVVVQRTAKRFTLRLGSAVVGIFNEAYDPTGIETPTGTVSPTITRGVRGERN
jgi:type IV secretion system protein VirB9